LDHKKEEAELTLQYIDRIVTNHHEQDSDQASQGGSTYRNKVITNYDPSNQRFKKICVAKEFDGSNHEYTFETLKNAID
jgi:hypothetical protein